MPVRSPRRGRTPERRVCRPTRALAKDYAGRAYDLVTCFDGLHDMGDPAGAAAHIRKSLKPDGTWMIVEPIAGNRPEKNLNPVGRLYDAASTMVCVPTSLAEVGAHGASRLREAIAKGGFRSVRRVPRSHSIWFWRHDSRPPRLRAWASKLIARPACLRRALAEAADVRRAEPRRHPLRVW
jgi:hypothetical protein